MTESGQDHYFRLVTFVVEGCPKPLIQLFILKAKADPRPCVVFTDLGTYLKYHESTIKRSNVIRQNQYYLIFPSTGSVDETKWDITLITSLLQNLFTLSSQERGHIKDIRDIRNELYHISGTATVSDDDFSDVWNSLENAVIKLGALCSNVVYNETKDYVEQLKRKPLPPADPILNQLKEWYSFDTSLNEIKENVIAEKKSINEMKDEVKQGNKKANAANQIAVKNKDMLKRAMVVSSKRSGKSDKRIKVADNALQKLKDHFKRTCNSQLPEGFIPDKADEDIQTKLNEHHRVVVSGSERSTYLASALYAIKKLNYKTDRCVQIARADDWNKVNYEDVDLVLCVDPFGCKRYNTKKANDMATIFDNALEEADDPNADTRISFVIATSAQSLKRFRHSDEHELLSEDVVIGLLSTGDSEDEWDHDITDPILKNLLAQSRSVIEQYRNDDHTIPMLQSAHEMFVENKHVLISGPRRMGKTTMAMRLLLPHTKDKTKYLCLVLNDPSDWKYVNVEYVKVVIIEDFCGKAFYDREMARKWLRKFDTIQASINEGKMRVIITSCDENLHQCREENLWHDLLETRIQLETFEENRTAKHDDTHPSRSQDNDELGNVVMSLRADTDKNVINLQSNSNADIVTSATMIDQFNVCLKNDENPCDVRGILVVGDFLYIADRANNKVKLFDMNGKYICELSVEHPLDMVDLNDSRVAVSQAKNAISIISKEESTSKIHIDQTIETSLTAFGISFYNGHLYVVCIDFSDPSVIPQIQVLTLEGKIKRRIEPVYQGSRVLQKPTYIVINQQTGTIYVTDIHKGVIALTTAGEIEFVQQAFNRTATAAGVAIDKYGHVYVCGVQTHNVMQISPDGKDVTEILKEECRAAVAIAIHEDKLFLGCLYTDIIRVFKMS